MRNLYQSKIILLKTTFLLFIGTCFVTSCDELTEVEPTPAYIHVNNIDLITTGAQGSDSHKITDAWLFANNQLIGVFELPFTAPVLVDGDTEVEIFAGTSENGIASAREVNPFYERFRVNKNLERGEVDTLFPVVGYSSNAEFVFIESFENSNLFGEDLDGSSITRIELWQSGAFEGNRSGRIFLETGASIFEAATSNLFTLPIDEISNPIYLELNYKNEIPFEIGVIGVVNNEKIATTYVVGINPKDTWNKVYLDLTSAAILMNADFYQIAIRSALPTTESTGEILLDNIKLLHQ